MLHSWVPAQKMKYRSLEPAVVTMETHQVVNSQLSLSGSYIYKKKNQANDIFKKFYIVLEDGLGQTLCGIQMNF